MYINSLKNISFKKINSAFQLAFADYEVHWNSDELKAMLSRRGFDPELSFAVFEGEDIVSFILNGTGYFNNQKTVYDTGTGTVKEYRGKGFVSEILEYSLPWLKKRNIRQYLLEVLQHNHKAISIYKNFGFEITREFNFFRQAVKNINNKVHYRKLPVQLIKVDLNPILSATNFWDFHPSWQNSFEAIERQESNFNITGAFIEQTLIGYSVSDPHSGDLMQIAVDKNHRRQGVGSSLLNEFLKYNHHNTVKIINADSDCLSMTKFLESKNINISGKQFEMMKKLN
ncbi:GNAT family N-acetyltransferase [Mangrovivirga sp. M17]|uniref:GNAT family N-acetyltransferase n=1 Tax=Mangrovivirga halotolerans TaxID=2993936 RepID=A0ABT3RVY0_9BACT|nr:GNAT family N-acetyltransferase [Mangrovivirga halotolerans]MCX2745315.1 GNAT family N-acetyltransferase [Mangrovivirga halotolerans]